MNADQAQAVLSAAECLYTVEQVEVALDAMAEQMAGQFCDLDPIVLCVMNGGLIPTAALLTRWDFPLQFDYIHATRYRNTTEGKNLHWIAAPHSDISGRVVIVVDDILDEGLTLAAIMEDCKAKGAEKIFSAVLLEKIRERPIDVRADFHALTVGDYYVFGYGMDYKGYLRNAPGIFAVKD